MNLEERVIAAVVVAIDGEQIKTRAAQAFDGFRMTADPADGRMRSE